MKNRNTDIDLKEEIKKLDEMEKRLAALKEDLRKSKERAVAWLEAYEKAGNTTDPNQEKP